MEIVLEDGERIDSLHAGNFKIIQNKNFFCFGMDAVLLSDFAFDRIDFDEKKLKILDLCSGNGIVPLLLCGKALSRKSLNLRAENFSSENNFLNNSGIHFCALEIQEKIADMARRTVFLNNLQDKISVKNGDLCKIEKFYDENSFDAVTCNPPYILPSAGRQSTNLERMIARQEICCSLKNVLDAAFFALKNGGSFFMVHRPERFKEICSALESSGLKIKNYRFVKPFENEDAKMVLFHCLAEKEGGAERRENKSVSAEISPLVVYREKGVYTLETEKIYGRKADESF